MDKFLDMLYGIGYSIIDHKLASIIVFAVLISGTWGSYTYFPERFSFGQSLEPIEIVEQSLETTSGSDENEVEGVVATQQSDTNTQVATTGTKSGASGSKQVKKKTGILSKIFGIFGRDDSQDEGDDSSDPEAAIDIPEDKPSDEILPIPTQQEESEEESEITDNIVGVLTEDEPEDPADPDPVLGCMDNTANNYNASATQEADPSSCTYDVPDPIIGCTDIIANNYNSLATQDTNPTSCTYDPPDPVLGCMDNTANNYNASATQEADPSSCTYDVPDPIIGCTDIIANNYNALATQDTNPTSCTYDPPDPVENNEGTTPGNTGPDGQPVETVVDDYFDNDGQFDVGGGNFVSIQVVAVHSRIPIHPIPGICPTGYYELGVNSNIFSDSTTLLPYTTGGNDMHLTNESVNKGSTDYYFKIYNVNGVKIGGVIYKIENPSFSYHWAFTICLEE